MDYSGKIIKKTPVTPSQTSASGVWTLDDAAQAQRTNTWPVANVPNPISRSLRFRSSASAKLSRTPSVQGSLTTWTFSFWLKMSYLGTANAQNFIMCRPAGNQYTTVYIAQVSGVYALHIDHYNGSQIGLLKSANQFRDPSAWYHIVCVFDTTNATSSDRLRMYVNGSRITSFTDSPVYPAQNTTGFINTTGAHNISSDPVYGGSFIDGYLTETHFIDGQALDPTYFGGTNAVTGVWEPRAYTGTYGTNGFYLNFKDNTSTTTLGYDYSGNNNAWTCNNISLTAGSTYDSMLDVPTQWIGYGNAYETTRGNYATLNPIFNPNGTIVTYSDANLAFSHSASAGNAPKMTVLSTISLPASKTYWEYTVGATVNDQLGIGTMLVVGGSADGTAGARYLNDGTFQSGYTNPSTAASYTTNDIIGMAYDQPNGTLAFYKNNSLQGTITNISTSEVFFALRSPNTSGSGGAGVFNFGQRPFSYTPPSGYLPLCTTNLPSPTILQGNQYFDVDLWTGTGATQSITTDFPVDFAWIKSRSSANGHRLFDIVRGATKTLSSNTTAAEATESDSLTAFTSTGYTLGADTSGGGVNTSPRSYVGWAWRANGAGVSNTAGSITSTVSANTTAGFSIATLTAQSSGTGTFGHGLGVAPSMVIVKQTGSTGSWGTYHVSVGNGSRLLLDSTAAAVVASSYWNNTSPTSSVVTLGTAWATAGTLVAYCFAAVAGYSAFGSYTGNGSTDGTFVYTGFRPRFIMIKKVSGGTGEWAMIDTARSPYNLVNLRLAANDSAAEQTFNICDILSNGFKFRNGDGIWNDANPFIYMAFAENPFKNALAR